MSDKSDCSNSKISKGWLVLTHNGQIIGSIPPVIKPDTMAPEERMRANWIESGGSAEQFDAAQKELKGRLEALEFGSWRAKNLNGFAGRPVVSSVAVDLNGDVNFLDESGQKLDL